MKKTCWFFLALGMLAIHCAPEPKQRFADTVLVNGVFFTADSRHPDATALAISGDTILAVGTDEEIRKWCHPQTRVIDLQGNFAMPGFIEGHGHFLGLGESLIHLNLMNTRNWQEIVSLVEPRVKQTPPGDWIDGRGWHQEKWDRAPGPSVDGYPYHDALSAISPDHPVILMHASGHALMANKKAMELAGISRETPDPIGGHIVRDAKGNAIGVFEEDPAMNLIVKPYEQWRNLRSEARKQADLEKTVDLAAQSCIRHGITSFQDAGIGFWELSQFRRLAENGQLPVRLWTMIGQPKRHEFDKFADYPQIGLGNKHFTCRAVKAYFDGALGSYGAWLLQPYDDKPGFTGQNTTPIDSIVELSGHCLRRGLQLCIHAIGDRANREVLNMFEHAFAGAGPSGADRRWRVEHAQHIDPQDIPRFAQLGVVASMQAIHCTSDAPFVVKRLGVERARTGAYAWRSLLDTGAHLANGTDTPVEDVDPLPCLYAAVTRKRLDTGFEFFPEQKMTREEALLSYTLWNAYAAFEEKEKGSLEKGKLADVVVLSKNLLKCPAEEIPQAKVLKTMVGGKIIFEQ